MQQKIVIIADDLTGAADTGVLFSLPGKPVELLIGTQELDRALAVSEVVAITLESRTESPEIAYHKHYTIGKTLKAKERLLVYKKLDSTLRGNIGAEIEGLMDGLQSEATLLAPALPANGRIINNGEVYVRGKKLNETDAARDPRTPVQHASIEAILSAQCHKLSKLIKRDFFQRGFKHAAANLLQELESGSEIFFFDTLNETDLENIADLSACFFHRHFLLAGSSGLARHLIKKVFSEEEIALAGKWDIAASKPSGPVFVFAGSVNGVSQSQVKHMLAKDNCELVYLHPEMLIRGEALPGAIRAIEHGIDRRKQNYIFTAALSSADLVASADKIATAIGALAAAVINRFLPSGIVLTGGETAIHTLLALTVSGIKMQGEILPGVQFGQLTGYENRHGTVVTKAGGFGDENALSDILEFLNR